MKIEGITIDLTGNSRILGIYLIMPFELAIMPFPLIVYIKTNFMPKKLKLCQFH